MYCISFKSIGRGNSLVINASAEDFLARGDMRRAPPVSYVCADEIYGNFFSLREC